MSVELACGQCQGRFLVAAPGTVVCPHCGTHVSVVAEVFSGQNDDGLTHEHSPLPTDDFPNPDTASQESEKLQNDAGSLDDDQPQPEEPDNAGPPSQADPASSPETESIGEFVPTEVPQAVQFTDANEMAAADVADVDGTGQPGDASAEAVGEQQREGEFPSQPEEVNETPDFPILQDEQPAQDEQQTLSISDGPPAAVPVDDSDAEAVTITVEEFSQQEYGSPTTDAPAEVFESSDPIFGEQVFGEQAANETWPDEFPDFSAPPEENAAVSAPDDVGESLENADNVTPDLSEQPAFLDEPPAVAEEPLPSGALPNEPAQKMVRHGVPTRWFIILASYASATTIVYLWLLFRMLNGVQQLNLDDPADAPVRGKKKVVRVYPINLQLPRGHELRVGDRRRYGHIFVQPLKVSRGRLEFVHFHGDQGMVKESTAPVLKLWLRFENVSDDQTIVPLDSLLLYSNRIRTKQNYEDFHANNFVVSRDAGKKSVGKLLHVYDINTNDVWDLKDQQLGKELKPGESCVIYVPTSEKDIDKMDGNLVWRLHFRKGYTPSNRGVTTLIDVKFDSHTIQNEPSPPADQSTASR